MGCRITLGSIAPRKIGKCCQDGAGVVDREREMLTSRTICVVWFCSAIGAQVLMDAALLYDSQRQK